MNEYVALTVLFGIFAIVLAVIVLRFTNVMQQMKRADSMDRVELMRTIDESHVQAFANAMSALGQVQDRVINSQTDMFNRTMDMVHGPAQTVIDNKEAYATDSERLEPRAAWQSEDEGDLTMQFSDPTDEDDWFGLTSDVQGDTGPRTVSVRPGESLVPGQ